MNGRVDLDELARLEEERAFLLRSIRDIEREHAVGDVDEHDYRTLRDGYVARAAVVLREIESGHRALPQGRRRSRSRLVGTVVLTLAVAVALGVYVASSAGQRLPGQSLTGGAPADEVALQLANARQKMGSDRAASQAAYAKVLSIEPDNVEAITYSSWLQVLSAREQGDPTLILDVIPDLQHATELDPDYADAHCFLAVATGRFLDPPMVDLALAEGQTCLDKNPPSMLVSQIESLMTELQAQAG